MNLRVWPAFESFEFDIGHSLKPTMSPVFAVGSLSRKTRCPSARVVTQLPNREDSCTEPTLLGLDEASAAMGAAGLDPLVLAQPAPFRGGKIFT